MAKLKRWVCLKKGEYIPLLKSYKVCIIRKCSYCKLQDDKDLSVKKGSKSVCKEA